ISLIDGNDSSCVLSRSAFGFTVDWSKTIRLNVSCKVPQQYLLAFGAYENATIPITVLCLMAFGNVFPNLIASVDVTWSNQANFCGRGARGSLQPHQVGHDSRKEGYGGINGLVVHWFNWIRLFRNSPPLTQAVQNRQRLVNGNKLGTINRE